MSLKERNVVITGGTGGIGKETAVALAGLGARVLIVGHHEERAKAAVDEIRARGGSDRVEHLLADLSSLAAVRKLAAEITARLDRLDVLVNNAGAIFMHRYVTDEGLERTFALNHLGYFLLTDLLKDLLARTGAAAGTPARIVSVASGAHSRGAIFLDDLQVERRKYGGLSVYCDSKLMNIMWTYELARRLDPKTVTANVLHPGPVATGWGRNDPSWFKIGVLLARPFLLSAAKGARTSIHLASAPAIDGVTGKYFYKSRAVPSSRRSQDEAVQRQLWQESEKVVARLG